MRARVRVKVCFDYSNTASLFTHLNESILDEKSS
jgi:hypothetical protein